MKTQSQLELVEYVKTDGEYKRLDNCKKKFVVEQIDLIKINDFTAIKVRSVDLTKYPYYVYTKEKAMELLNKYTRIYHMDFLITECPFNIEKDELIKYIRKMKTNYEYICLKKGRIPICRISLLGTDKDIDINIVPDNDKEIAKFKNMY